MTLTGKTNRQTLRMTAVQILFQFDMRGDEFGTQVDEFLQSHLLTSEQALFVERLVDASRQHQDRIDQLIREASQHWDLHRIAPVDRAILRLAIGELLHVPDTPPKVVINEAIELAKVLGTAESPQFVNGLLDAIYKKVPRDS